MAPFYVDPAIGKAATLPTDFYTLPEHFRASLEKICTPSWQFVGNGLNKTPPGFVSPVTLWEGSLNEPLLLARDENGTLRCLSNVCTHRGALLVEKPCAVKEIRCPYHGRRFHLNGKFLSMPEFREVENFPSESDHLTTLPLFDIGNLTFTSLKPALPANHFFGDMLARIGWMPLDQLVYRADLSNDYTVNAHWALYCENYLEGFHIPFVHAGLNKVIDYGNYTTELFPFSILQLGIARDGEMAFDLPPGSPDVGKKIAAYYFWVFPNLMFNFYPWGLSLNIVLPLGIDKTKVLFKAFVWDQSKLDKGAGSGLHTVEMEDEAIVESVQRGIRSRFYQQGRYSVTREQGTHHFHRLISQFMDPSNPA